MKNLLLALSLFFAVGINAQTKKNVVKAQVVSVKISDAEKAKKNVSDLNAFTPIEIGTQNILLELFTTKYKMFAEGGSEGLSPERKSIVSSVIERKLEATLDGVIFEKIKSNTVLFKSLVN